MTKIDILVWTTLMGRLTRAFLTKFRAKYIFENDGPKKKCCTVEFDTKQSCT